MRSGTGLFAILIPVIVVLSGCSSHLTSFQDLDPDIALARLDYQSGWDESISKHQIVKGMSVTDVYFSWGRPQHRFRTGNRERWIYLFESDDEQPDRVIWLFFKDGKLKKWSVDRGFMEFVNPSTIETAPESGRSQGQGSGK
jgi:hypothetical protein